VREAIASGVKGFDTDTRKSVRKAARDLRLSRELAMSVASKEVGALFPSILCSIYDVLLFTSNVMFC